MNREEQQQKLKKWVESETSIPCLYWTQRAKKNRAGNSIIFDFFPVLVKKKFFCIIFVLFHLHESLIFGKNK